MECNASECPRYPKNAADVEEIVKEAIGKGVAVKAFSHMRSQSDLICTAGIPISIGNLTFTKMNRDKTVTFGAAVKLYDCFEFLRKHDRSLAILPVNGNGAVAAAVLKGAHGNSLRRDSTFASLVVKMTIINSKGKRQVISRPEDLQAYTLGLGLLGKFNCSLFTLSTCSTSLTIRHCWLKFQTFYVHFDLVDSLF